MEDDDGQAAHEQQLELQRRDIEDAFDHAKQGKATEAEWGLIAWQLGIDAHYKRISTKEKQHEMV